MQATQVSSRSRNGAADVDGLANGLGWFSIGLGLAEVMAPGAVANLIGTDDSPRARTLLRTYGAREIAAGIGILTQEQPAGWMWARVAGDALDLSSLAAAAGRNGVHKGKLGFAIASVAGVTALDVYCARQLSAGQSQNGASRNTRAVRTVIIDRPAQDVYQYWHEFENLPNFMEYLESVRKTGPRSTHWVAKGPGGLSLEWDAETTFDEPGRVITWQTAEGSDFKHSGSVRFERAPGDRGTLVKVEFDYSKSPSLSMFGKIVQMDLGRRLLHDLRNFKQVMEVGEVTQSDASIHSGMHPAQPA